MYNVLINIATDYMIVSRLQSYDIISKVVSVAYGKCASKMEKEIAANQWIMICCIPPPMESFCFLSYFRVQRQQKSLPVFVIMMAV